MTRRRPTPPPARRIGEQAVTRPSGLPSLRRADLPTAPLASSLLVLGGARSGKTRYAQRLVEAAGGGILIATAEAGDAEMAERIARHQQDRGPDWQTVEEPLRLVETLTALAGSEGDAGRPILVDCLTLWLSNLMLAGQNPAQEVERLAACLPGLHTPVILVSNEVGLGIVPENALARRFRDQAGWMNQRIAAAATRVVFVAAGLPLPLK